MPRLPFKMPDFHGTAYAALGGAHLLHAGMTVLGLHGLPVEALEFVMGCAYTGLALKPRAKPDAAPVPVAPETKSDPD